jgi:PAS domain S-box-containing protein
MGVLTLWYPDYWLDGMVKLFTAVVSIFIAAAMWWVMPKALAMPSMAQLEDANRRLQHEIGERERAEAALRDANAQLEQRVAARTAELEGEVAQRRCTEETLRASEQRWRSMFEASAVGIALTDENRRFVAANKAFQEMLGYSEEELCRVGPIEITHEDDREATREMLDNMLLGRSSGYHVEKRYQRKDGTVIWVRVSTAQAPEPGSTRRGIPTIIEDITERKRAEDAFQEARDALLRVTRLSTMGELSASIATKSTSPSPPSWQTALPAKDYWPRRSPIWKRPRRRSTTLSATAGVRAQCWDASVSWPKNPRRNERRSTSTAPSRRCCP